MKEIKVGSYWRDKERRNDIVQVHEVGISIRWSGVMEQDARSAWGGWYNETSFFNRFEPLNRLEVLVLFGEYIDGD